VNNATARVQTKKTPTVPNVCLQWPEAAALRGVAIQRGRARAYPSAAAAAAAFGRHPTPLTAAATAIHGYTPGVYYDPFLAAHAASADPNYRLQAGHATDEAAVAAAAGNPAAVHGLSAASAAAGLHAQAQAAQAAAAMSAAGGVPSPHAAAAASHLSLLKAPALSTAQQASYAAAASYTAAAARAYGAAAAAAQPVAGYAAVAGNPLCLSPASSYGREYADPYLGHSIGPVAGYGAAVYRSGYNRFAPY
ncbi:hypothetical protein B566_EDAN010378, partial [Ephemera danica]